MDILAAIMKNGRMLPFAYTTTTLSEEERWYAALLAAENESVFGTAEVAYAGVDRGDVVLTTPKYDGLFRSKVMIPLSAMQAALKKLGWTWVVVELPEKPTNEQLRQPFVWMAEQAAGVLR